MNRDAWRAVLLMGAIVLLTFGAIVLDLARTWGYWP